MATFTIQIMAEPKFGPASKQINTTIVHYHYLNKTYTFKRYPPTQNRSLVPWSAAEEHILAHISERNLVDPKMAITNDRFGFLSVVLNEYAPQVMIDSKSQEKAIRANHDLNKRKCEENKRILSDEKYSDQISLGVMTIPKSVALFHFYLHGLHQNLTEDGVVFAGFMTRHFTAQWLETASLYFENVRQSKAWKKSRVLILEKPKKVGEQSFWKQFEGTISPDKKIPIWQHAGVFSESDIDLGTRFLLENMSLSDSEYDILDLGCGNGIIAKYLHSSYPDRKYHAMDDSRLALKAARKNFDEGTIQFHWQDSLSEFSKDSLDVIISNPPFHFGYEINIEVTTRLFEQSRNCLRSNGRLLIVANRHLNYKTHLQRLFPKVRNIAENDAFEVIECLKS